MIKLKSLISEETQAEIDKRRLESEINRLELSLKDEFPQIEDLHLALHSNWSLHIGSIRINKEDRGKGIGREVINRIKKFADDNDLTITLIPQPESRYKAKLHKFYKDTGFIRNKGRNTDYSLSMAFAPSMYRRPEKKVSI